jgi:transposase
MKDDVLRDMRARFSRSYAKTGRPSIAPEKLLRALLLQVLHSLRSERLLMEQLDYNRLFRWFVDSNLDDPIGNATAFTKNRQRLLDGEIAKTFLTPCCSKHDSASCSPTTFHGRRHAVGSLGRTEELSSR